MSHTHYRSLSESEYLGQWDLTRDGTPISVVVIIDRVERYTPERPRKRPDGKPELNKKILITFRGKSKRWIANSTGQQAIAGMFGPYTENWLGKAITIYCDPDVMFGSRKVGGIKVRPTPPKLGTPPTTDPLDRPEDPEKRAAIRAAIDEVIRQPGKD